MKRLRVGVGIGLLLAATACGSGGDSATTSPSTPPVTQPATTTTEPVTTMTEPATTVAPSTSTLPPAVITTTAATSTTESSLIDVKVYLLRGERLVIAHRLVAGPAVLSGALTELLAGPTAGEAADGLISIVPDGTQLLDVNLRDGVAIVDLTSQFESGGGSLSMTARVAQVVFTATQFDNVDSVLFSLDGAPIDYLGGEGLVADEPWARMDVDRNLTGSVIFDTPAYRATVSSPFTVTGEGDVFEAQFPVEIWANGVQIGFVGGVWAGAWGEWAPFETTITVDAPAGPIELIGYDAGGCGTGPDCPEIIKTVLPLTFTG